jgi:hypothetical protein
MDACNYNADATVDDGSCDFPDECSDCDGECTCEVDCAGDCGGSAEVDECGDCNGDGPEECWDGSYECDSSDCPDQPGETLISFGAVSEEGSLEVLMSNSAPVAGFQFDITGITITGASGGSAEDAGFMISTSPSTVIGFSLTGATIPAGGGVLVNVDFEGGGKACLDNVVLSDADGNSIDVEVGDCVEAGDIPELPSAPIPIGVEGSSGISPASTQSPTSTSIEFPSASDKTTLSRQALPPPSKSTFTSTPPPAGMVAPVKLNPMTVEGLVDIMNPASSADPPEAPVIVIPVISNWKPATGALFDINTSNEPSSDTAPNEINVSPG